MGDDRGVAVVAAPPDDAVGAQPRRSPTRSTRDHTNAAYLPGLHAAGAAHGDRRPREGGRATPSCSSSACRRSAFRATLATAAAWIHPWIPVVSLTKGLEQGSLLRMTEVINDVLPGHPAAALTGPNIAREIMAGQAAASVIATEDLAVAAAIQQVLTRGAVPHLHQPRRHRLRARRGAEERRRHRLPASPRASASATTPAPR